MVICENVYSYNFIGKCHKERHIKDNNMDFSNAEKIQYDEKNDPLIIKKY